MGPSSEQCLLLTRATAEAPLDTLLLTDVGTKHGLVQGIQFYTSPWILLSILGAFHFFSGYLFSLHMSGSLLQACHWCWGQLDMILPCWG